MLKNTEIYLPFQLYVRVNILLVCKKKKTLSGHYNNTVFLPNNSGSCDITDKLL